MARTSITIVLEIKATAEHLEGRARPADGPWRMFNGWLGLAEAIDALTAQSTGRDARRDPDQPIEGANP